MIGIRKTSPWTALKALATLAILAGSFLVGTTSATAGGLEPAASYTPQRAFANLNNWRSQAGIPPVESLDPEMSEGCRLHNKYMSMHGIGHDEKKGTRGYTELGARAGSSSVLSGGEYLPRPGWEDAVYHRASLLNPRLRVTGYSASFGYTCMGVFGEGGAEARSDDLRLYPWPYDGQTNVPLRFGSLETPDPYDEAPGANQLGYLFSVSVNGPWRWSPDSYVTEASLTGDSGKRVPIAISDARSKHGNHLNGGFGLFPKVALQPGTLYTIRVSGKVEGSGQGGEPTTFPFQRTWRFRTVPPRPKIIRPRLRLRKIGQNKRALRFRLWHDPRLRGQPARIVVGRIRLFNCDSTGYCSMSGDRAIRRARVRLRARPITFRIPRARTWRVIRTLKVITPRTKIGGNRIIAGRTVERNFQGPLR